METAASGPKNPQQQEKVPSPRPIVIVPEPPSAGLGVMVARILKPEHTPISENCDILNNTNDSEPEFQTTKERECWQLYRRMLEKGVSVSYDTVLRGMLTPTEYRLRRNALLSTTVRQLV
ncbi:hypothetical protein L9F63_017026 [Diploptera punctata]|uniref:Uncharacterized protein n=1 Tax=Diploptera punctata TaxID=6984 RepID=A0AAD8EH21_DIPPU|nr:hypothetical protein L9F63_017026 [Diploptera punctata]